MAYQIRAEMEYEKNLNYIRYLNGLYSIKKIKVYNEGDEPAKDLKLSLSFTPEFAQSWVRGLPEIQPGQMLEVVPTELSVDPAVMLDYNETIEGSINVEISDAEPVFKQAFPVTLLAYDIWYGGSHPELLASFVTPNDRKVLEIVANAGKKTGIAFTGYDATRTEIMKAIKAIFEAIQELKITYDYPPVNWKSGQRVRMPGFVVNNSVGCCIDMAVLFASCMEAIHLNPLIMLVDGHAVAGAWLKNLTFDEAVEWSREKVESRSYNKLRELCMVECTLMENYASGDLFEYAVNSTDKLYPIFNQVIDVKRARAGGIRPIPLKEIHDDIGADVDYVEDEREDSDAFYEEEEFLLTEEGEPENKIEYWERKILDLSLRNSLVSMKPGSRVLPVMADLEALGKLSLGLERERTFRLLPAPKELAELPGIGDLDGQQACIREQADLIASDLQNARVRLLLGEKETSAKLKGLHRTAENFIRESGTNVLYLAMGALRWRQEAGAPDKYAPILLIPVRLEKKRADDDYVLVPTSDEWQLNLSLLEMLKEKYGIQVKLTGVPRGEEGVPYKALFNTVREAVKTKGFDVQERAFLGIFSFGQLMMWRDLHANKDNPAFTKQPFVASMVDGHLTWQPKGVFADPAALEAAADPRDLLLPLSADGSQMTAIQAALGGESFVMHGPPGTGKSQTITDMIANLLAAGKTVLFLTKKMAALEVVQQRLEEIGLGEFCLELHANKSSRQHVMDQFSRALALGRESRDPLYDAQARKIKEKERELASLLQDLHRPQPCGLSLYELMAMMETYKDAPAGVTFDDATLRMVNAQDYASWKLQAASLQRSAKKLEGMEESLGGIRKASFRRKEKEALLQGIEKALQVHDDLMEAISGMEAVTGLEDGALAGSREAVTGADILAHIKVYPPQLTRILQEKADLVRGEAQILSALESEGELQEQLRELSRKYDSAVLEEDLAGLRKNVESASHMFFGGGRVVQTAVHILREHAKDPGSVTEDTVKTQLENLLRIREKIETARAKNQILRETDWTRMPAAEECGRIFDRRRLVEERLNRLDIGRGPWAGLMDYARERTFGSQERYEEDLPAFMAVSDNYDALKEAVLEVLTLSGYEYDGEPSDLIFDPEWFARLRSWKENFFEIDSWSAWLTESEQARAGGLDPLVTAMEQGLAPDDVEAAFYRGFAESSVRYIVGNNKKLQYFSGNKYELTMDQYRKLCEQFEEMTRREIRARLTSRIPDVREGSGLRDLVLLQKAVRGSGDQLTIRELFGKMPEAVRLLAPCMLMSPASVAQYIDMDFPKFDVVIIDEASQLPTCEAVGAIARGRSVVIAGDEHQLPPTRFFQKRQKGEDIEVSDLESILEDALALNMPQCYLNWHYRSAHESLIAFSNQRYYGGRLKTFPSVDNRVSAVHFCNVGGVYDRSGTRTNPVEADALIAAMRQRILRGSEDSIGVITFNIQQCRLIEEKWDKLLEEDAQLAAAVESRESVLIKNLENIQGDERDVIYFSVGFGPDAQGSMSQNFGPVNQKGGHRRLNVAITRARKEMCVFASFDPSALTVTPASPAGVRDLADFLRFAKGGMETLTKTGAEKDQEKETVCGQIARSLEQEGYQADTCVGSSGFVIDLAVRDPADPDRYLLGILLDDSRSALEDTVRDRCILQKNVLRRMGWNLTNVWLLDWFDSPDTQIYKIKQVIGRLKKA